MGDQELDKIHKRVLQDLCPEEPASLRIDPVTRHDVAEKAGAILETMNSYFGDT